MYNGVHINNINDGHTLLFDSSETDCKHYHAIHIIIVSYIIIVDIVT